MFTSDPFNLSVVILETCMKGHDVEDWFHHVHLTCKTKLNDLGILSDTLVITHTFCVVI